MIRTRMMLWTALALGGSLPTLADAQQSHQPPAAMSNDIQLYSRPLEEEQAASALPESPARPRPELDRSTPAPVRPGSGYDGPPTEPDAAPLPTERGVAPRPIPKVRYEDLPPESPASIPDSPPIPKPRYNDRPQPASAPPPEPDEDTSGSDWPPPSELLDIQNYRGIRYVSGGVGEDERAELNALSSRFNLRLLFAMQSSGSYVADVRVNIRDERGGLALVAKSKGPWFFAALPPGTYTIEAEASGSVQRQTVRIGGTAQSRLNFYWR